MSERDIHLFTSESVTEGHPDKVADQISDAVLDASCARTRRAAWPARPWSPPAWSFLAGEITTKAYVDFAAVARQVDPRDRLHAEPSSASTARPAPCCRPSTRSRPTSPRASTPAAPATRG